MKSARTKALDITQKVKKRVWERDGHCCIFCGSPYAMPNAHYIPRSQGGLGIEQNVVTACVQCHDALDHTAARKEMLEQAEEYLKNQYPDWDKHDLTFWKYGSTE